MRWTKFEKIMKTKIPKGTQEEIAIAAKIANSDELTNFFDAVQARLDLYDKDQAEISVVEPRPMNHY